MYEDERENENLEQEEEMDEEERLLDLASQVENEEIDLWSLETEDLDQLLEEGHLCGNDFSDKKKAKWYSEGINIKYLCHDIQSTLRSWLEEEFIDEDDLDPEDIDYLIEEDEEALRLFSPEMVLNLVNDGRISIDSVKSDVIEDWLNDDLVKIEDLSNTTIERLIKDGYDDCIPTEFLVNLYLTDFDTFFSLYGDTCQEKVMEWISNDVLDEKDVHPDDVKEYLTPWEGREKIEICFMELFSPEFTVNFINDHNLDLNTVPACYLTSWYEEDLISLNDINDKNLVELIKNGIDFNMKENEIRDRIVNILRSNDFSKDDIFDICYKLNSRGELNKLFDEKLISDNDFSDKELARLLFEGCRLPISYVSNERLVYLVHSKDFKHGDSLKKMILADENVDSKVKKALVNDIVEATAFIKQGEPYRSAGELYIRDAMGEDMGNAIIKTIETEQEKKSKDKPSPDRER